MSFSEKVVKTPLVVQKVVQQGTVHKVFWAIFDTDLMMHFLVWVAQRQQQQQRKKRDMVLTLSKRTFFVVITVEVRAHFVKLDQYYSRLLSE